MTDSKLVQVGPITWTTLPGCYAVYSPLIDCFQQSNTTIDIMTFIQPINSNAHLNFSHFYKEILKSCMVSENSTSPQNLQSYFLAWYLKIMLILPHTRDHPIFRTTLRGGLLSRDPTVLTNPHVIKATTQPGGPRSFDSRDDDDIGARVLNYHLWRLWKQNGRCHHANHNWNYYTDTLT